MLGYDTQVFGRAAPPVAQNKVVKRISTIYSWRMTLSEVKDN